MKKLITAGIVTAVLAIGGAASAADLPVRPVYKAPVMAPVVYNWTGLYVGLNAGYSWGRSSTDFTVAGLPFSTASTNLNGWLGGGQIGYNWQTGQWVFGLEADLQATGQKGTLLTGSSVVCPLINFAPLPCTTSSGSLEQKLPWFGTVRGRLGVTATPTWLLYVTGGLAYGEVDSNLTTTAAVAGGLTTTALSSVNQTKAGWTVGAGTEWAFAGTNWTAKLEYLYVDLGSVSGTLTGVGPFTPVGFTSRITDNIVRLGVNYRFGGGPVVARY